MTDKTGGGQPPPDAATVLRWLNETKPPRSRLQPTIHDAETIAAAFLSCGACASAESFHRPDEGMRGITWVSDETIKAADALLRKLSKDIDRHRGNAERNRNNDLVRRAFTEVADRLQYVGQTVEALDTGRKPKLTWHRIAREISAALDVCGLSGFQMPKRADRESWRVKFIVLALFHFRIAKDAAAVSAAIRGKRGGHKKPLKMSLERTLKPQ